MDVAKQHNRTIRNFLRDERGMTAVEYALIAAGIAVTIVTAVNSLGDSVSSAYERIGTAVGS